MKRNEDSHYQPSDEFNHQMVKLLTLLKKALKSNKFSQEEVKKIFGELKANNKDNFNLNVFFLTFMPIGPDELDELGSDFEEVFDEELEREEPEEELKFELSSNDHEFLKKHGIKF